MPSIGVERVALGVLVLVFVLCTASQAQNPTVNDLKAKIFDARMTQKTFVNGLRFCNELDGSNFYYERRNRVLNLEEYHRSLESLAGARAFNPETRRPWNEQDANARWEQVKQQAVRDKESCALVASLPQLEKQLQELEAKTEASKK